MAALQYRNETYRVIFRYRGKQHSFTVGKVSSEEAATKCSQVDYLLMRLKQGLLTLPMGVDIVDYLQFDGQKPPVEVMPPEPVKLTLREFRDRYLATHEISLEPSTLATIRIHFRHLARHFGETLPVADVTLADLQGYVDRRTNPPGKQARKISATTIKKEIVTLRTAWNWAVRMGLLSGQLPADGLSYPKTKDKPPFQTLAEIERQIQVGGLTDAEQGALHDALYLKIEELTEFLMHVKTHATHGFLYPMCCLAAHTGARRSELIRLKLSDVDLDTQVLTIHERKRVRGRETTRRVPMSAFLTEVIREWLSRHPGGPWLFCHQSVVPRSRKRNARSRRGQGHSSGAQTALTKDEAHDHFKRSLNNSRWNVVRGWHVLRHSFVSACANRGIDQRLVEAWAGHMSQEMSRRYAHLYPSTQREALSAVFGTPSLRPEHSAQGHEKKQQVTDTKGEGESQAANLLNLKSQLPRNHDSGSSPSR